MKLNRAQLLAATHGPGAMLVLAGPGSGKTAVITERVRYLIDEYKVPPEKILVITFSRAAAVQMKERFAKLTSGDHSSVHFGTFHAVFFNIIKNETQYDNSSIISESEKYRIVREKLKDLNIVADRSNQLAERVVAAISAIKGNSPGDDHGRRADSPELKDLNVRPCSAEEFAEVFRAYNDYLMGEGKLDFDDMMGKCLELFEKDPECRARWQEKYAYILIDEFQDINALQYKLVKMLAEPENNLFAVGDDDQSIYGFRGAKPDIMFRFETDFRNSGWILLDVNYRSHSEILDCALALVGHNKKRFKKRLSGHAGSGGSCELIRFESFEQENAYISEYLKGLTEQGKELKNTAVLFRMRNEVSMLYRQLRAENIPCRIGEKPPCIFDHIIAQDMFAYLRTAESVKKGIPAERADILRIINRPNRYVTRESIMAASSGRSVLDLNDLRKTNSSKRYVCENLDNLLKNLQFLSNLDVYTAIKYILKAAGYDAWLKEYAKEKHLSYEEMVEITAELEQSGIGCGSLSEWLEKAEEFRSGLDEREPEDGVVLMTFHASKGLEFDTVFILDLLEGFTPSNRAETQDQIEEERRALYVAMTRARKRLVLMTSRERLGRTLPESRFLKEIEKGATKKEL